MTSIHTPAAEILAVDVTVNGFEHYIFEDHSLNQYLSCGSVDPDIKLPPGQWQIIGMSDELKFDQMALFTETQRLSKGYKWKRDLRDASIYSEYKSLLKSHNIHKPVLILIKL